MPVTIDVFYPEADGTVFTEADIEALRVLEPTIIRRAVALFNSTSNYRWEHDSEISGSVYAKLVKRSDSREIVSQPLAYLRDCAPDDFEALLVKRSFEITREEQNTEPSA